MPSGLLLHGWRLYGAFCARAGAAGLAECKTLSADSQQAKNPARYLNDAFRAYVSGEKRCLEKSDIIRQALAAIRAFWQPCEHID